MKPRTEDADSDWPIDPIVVGLRKLRQERKMTRLAVARRIGCSPSHLLRIERGERQPSLYLLRVWCDAFEDEGLVVAVVRRKRKPPDDAV